MSKFTSDFVNPIHSLHSSVYSYRDSDIYTDFTKYKVLYNQEILEKIEHGEISGSINLAECIRARSYRVLEPNNKFYPLFDNLDRLFTDSVFGQDFNLINQELLYWNQSTQTEHLVKSSTGKYYLIKSDHFHQIYSWEEVKIPEEFIQLYLGSSLQSKVNYAIRCIENVVDQFNITSMQTHRNSSAINKKQFDFTELDFGQIDPNCFVEINLTSLAGTNYIIWCDQDKMFGWYPDVKEDFNWVYSFLGVSKN